MIRWRSRSSAVGTVSSKREARLEIGLIEAGKEHVRVGRDEQRVEIVAAVGLVVKADDARPGRRDERREATRRPCSAPAFSESRGNSKVRAVPVERARHAASLTATLESGGPRKSTMTSAWRCEAKRDAHVAVRACRGG